MKETDKCFIIHLLSYVSLIFIGVISLYLGRDDPFLFLLIIPLIILWIGLKYAYYLPWYGEFRGAYIYAKIIDKNKIKELNKIFEEIEGSESTEKKK